MAIACPVDLNTALLRSEISSIYSRVAVEPDGEFHFHRGPAFAAEFLGYDAAELAALPADCTASFAGIGNPLAIGPIHEGETVLDIGCGAGMDLLLAARRTSSKGHAIGVDMTDAMVERARQSAKTAGLHQAEVRKGDATSLPVADASVDVVSSNGVLNLVPEKDRGFAEIMRVLKPGGRLLPGGYCSRHGTPGGCPPKYRPLDRLNRRRAAGGRACEVFGADRTRGRADHCTF